MQLLHFFVWAFFPYLQILKNLSSAFFYFLVWTIIAQEKTSSVMLLLISIWLFSLATEQGYYEQLEVNGHSVALKMDAVPPALSFPNFTSPLEVGVEKDIVREEAYSPHLLAEAPICMQKTQKFMGYKLMWFGARPNSAL